MSFSSLSSPPSQFIAYNTGSSKNLNVVVDIDGAPLISAFTVYRYWNYGDPGITYGTPGLVYGGLVPVGFTGASERQQKNFLMLNGNLSINQRLEPEQGRGSISTLTMSFLDKDGYMTQLVSPSIILPEILGRQVKIWIGYGPTSFPQDYFVVWRGRVGQVMNEPGKVTMQFLDPNVVRRQQIFYCGQTTLATGIYDTSHTINPTYSAETWSLGGHGLLNGDVVSVSSSGSLPTGMTYYLFTVTPAIAYAGAQYTNNGHTFTVVTTIQGAGSLLCTGTGAPTSSGVLAFSTGTGDSVITFSGSTSPTLPYYVISNTGSSFQLSGEVGGAVIPTTTNGSGTFTVSRDAGIIPVNSNTNFFEKITGPNGSYDGQVRLFVKIDNEFIEYQQAGSEASSFQDNVFFNCVRGVSPVSNMSTPSVAATHAAGATVDGYIMISGHAMDIALKLMLSGWNGPFLQSQAIYSFVTTDDSSLPTVSNGVVLAKNVDAVRDLGMTPGDYITVTGASNSGNNGTFVITGFSDLTQGQKNRVILTSHTFTSEDPSSALIAVRSQYDTFPVLAGCALPGWEVDVGAFQYYKATYLENPDNAYQFLINGTGEAGKTFIESEILLPVGAYSLTRQGKISMGLTKPPIADQRTQILDVTNVMEPQSIKVQRGVNNRKFFNEIDWSFDCDETNTPTSQRNTLDSTSLSTIGISSVLPITSRGARTSLGFLNVVSDRETWLFNRYKNASVLIDLKTNLAIGNQVEVGDVLIVNDNGQLQIPNYATGKRNIGAQFFEVINRSLGLESGQTQLQLEGGVGALVSDRYATIAPSSLLTAASSPSRIVITESFGAIFPGNEQKKWTSYVGYKVRVHSPDFLNDATTTFTGLDPANNHALFLSPALPFTPQAGWILDLAQYSLTSATDQALIKLIHGFADPSVAITQAISTTQFKVSSGDAAKFTVGLPVLVHNATYSLLSPEVLVSSVSGTTITVGSSLGFAPDASCKVELIGFTDGGQPYRMV